MARLKQLQTLGSSHFFQMAAEENPKLEPNILYIQSSMDPQGRISRTSVCIPTIQ